MEHSPKTIGRMELAQLYFPYILPRSAWQKLKSLLDEDPSLKHHGRFRRFKINRKPKVDPLTKKHPSAYG